MSVKRPSKLHHLRSTCRRIPGQRWGRRFRRESARTVTDWIYSLPMLSRSRPGFVGLISAIVLLVPVSSPATAAPGSSTATEQAVQSALNRISGDSRLLGEFMLEFPKGADLHQHVSGAVYAESLLLWAADQGMCIAAATYQAYPAPCTSGDYAATALLTNTLIQGKVIANWSMRLFEPSMTDSGHDQFFDAFSLFGPVLSTTTFEGQALAEVLRQADRDHLVRQETMLTPGATIMPQLTATLASSVPGASADPARFPQALAALKAAGLDTAVAQATATTDSLIAATDAALACGGEARRLGCDVDYGLIAQVNRNGQPDKVFTQMALNFALAQQDGRWIAVNLVSPEDGLLAMRDYTLHMQMVRYLHEQYPRAHISLHAGELIPGLVPPSQMDFHIRQAVVIAGAERIGHGVAIRSERNSGELLRLMKAKGVSVEVALTSNQQILDVGPKDSQFPVYLDAGVAVTLATDDPGIERTDMSAQYRLAYEWFDLSYKDLKALAYAGLDEAFITPAQRTILKKRLDAHVAAFEKKWSR